MELQALATQDLSESGIWKPVEIYGKRQDFDLLILGEDSDAVQRHTRKAMRKLRGRVKNDGGVEIDDETLDDLEEVNDEGVLVRIAGIRGWKVERKGNKEISRELEPVTLNGKELKNDRASYELLIKNIPAIKEFVLSVSRKRESFLGEGN